MLRRVPTGYEGTIREFVRIHEQRLAECNNVIIFVDRFLDGFKSKLHQILKYVPPQYSRFNAAQRFHCRRLSEPSDPLDVIEGPALTIGGDIGDMQHGMNCDDCAYTLFDSWEHCSPQLGKFTCIHGDFDHGGNSGPEGIVDFSSSDSDIDENSQA